MKQDAIVRWEQTRARGFLRFVLIRGVVAYGLPMFLTLTFVVHPERRTPLIIAISVIAWGIGGALAGGLMWHFSERGYRRAVSNQGGKRAAPDEPLETDADRSPSATPAKTGPPRVTEVLNDAPSAETELQEYVEREIKRAVSAVRPQCKIRFRGGDFPPLVPVSQPLWWTIESPDMDESELLIARSYLVEAHLEESRFVVWFGGLAGFVGDSPRDVMFPAVHIPFPWALDEWAQRSLLPGIEERLRDLRKVRPEIVGAFFGSSLNRTKVPEEYSLGTVLRWMLEHEGNPAAPYDPIVYPMSGCRY